MNMCVRSGIARQIVFVVVIIAINLLTGSVSVGASSGDPTLVRERLRRRIEVAEGSLKFSVRDEIVFASVTLPLFYERRAFEPAWVDEDGPRPAVKTLLSSLGKADLEGLRPQDYHLDDLNALYLQAKERTGWWSRRDIGALVDLELLCTDAFLIYSSHLLSGCVNPQTIDAEWFANRRDADLAGILEAAIAEDAVDSVFNSMLPPQTGYWQLRSALARYRELQSKGGWNKIDEGPTMKAGSQDSRIAALRKRLVASGDLSAIAGDSTIFDRELEEAVMHFQRRHGLDIDGSVGPAALSALNVPISERISQLIINLERWRWLPQDLGSRHVLVNIASFELDIVEKTRIVERMRVIVGKSYRRTPVFSDRITYLVVNPYWNVPHALAVNDILPKVKTKQSYLADDDFELLSGWGEDMQLVDPGSVDWIGLSAKRFPYRLRQKPGPKNALGKIKFMFPNQFNVYLHDTPERGLFAKATRSFSSGCIRVERPLALAEYLLRDQPQWAGGRLKAQIDSGIEQTIRLSEPIAIHILYWTAWADADGTVNFRSDVYDRDRPLFEALREEPPSSN